jgi:hypothetical protein
MKINHWNSALKTMALLTFFGLLIGSCNIPRPSNSNLNEIISTEVSAARTLTAMSEVSTVTPITSKVTTTPNFTTTPSLLATASPSPTPINFNEKLGMPTWKDDLNSGARWSLSKPNTDTPNVTISVENGVLSMTRSVAYGGKNWWLNYQILKNFYLEAKFRTESCSSNDQYGLVFRAPNYNSGFGYYFTLTCDGYFNLMRWDQYGAVNLFKWEKADAIQSGANKSNSFGIWAMDDLIKLYANGILIKEISDSSLTSKGHFGLFIDPQQSPGFRIEMDEISFWENPQQ